MKASSNTFFNPINSSNNVNERPTDDVLSFVNMEGQDPLPVSSFAGLIRSRALLFTMEMMRCFSCDGLFDRTSRLQHVVVVCLSVQDSSNDLSESKLFASIECLFFWTGTNSSFHTLFIRVSVDNQRGEKERARKRVDVHHWFCGLLKWKWHKTL